jgi:NADH:ubiquinone oxidoreductase subunit E
VEKKNKIDMAKKKTAFHGKDHSLLVQLQEAQEQFGYIPEKFMAEVAQSLNTSLSEAFGVTTFYSFLANRPMGRNVIRTCQSLPCYLKNAEMIIKSLEDVVGIRPGESTPDGRFSFELTNCIGACDQAPAMLINSDVHVNLTPQKISRVLKKYE